MRFASEKALLKFGAGQFSLFGSRLGCVLLLYDEWEVSQVNALTDEVMPNLPNLSNLHARTHTYMYVHARARRLGTLGKP
jgi:hypothetical protein